MLKSVRNIIGEESFGQGWKKIQNLGESLYHVFNKLPPSTHMEIMYGKKYTWTKYTYCSHSWLLNNQ